jgi:hypothetical protein
MPGIIQYHRRRAQFLDSHHSLSLVCAREQGVVRGHHNSSGDCTTGGTAESKQPQIAGVVRLDSLRIDTGDSLAAAQRAALQRRRVRDREAGRAEATFQKRHDLAGAQRRPLQAPVGWQLGSALLVIFEPVFQYGNFIDSAQQSIGFVQERQRHHRQRDVTQPQPYFEAIHIHNWFPCSVSEPVLHVANDLDLNAVDFERTKVRLHRAGAGKCDRALLVAMEKRLKCIGILGSGAYIDVVNRNRKTLQRQSATTGNCPSDWCSAKLISNQTKNGKQRLWNAHRFGL